MQKRALGTLILTGFVAVTGCATNPTLSASDDFLTIAGQRWRRTGALNTELLRVGVRRGGPFRRGENAFDSKAHIEGYKKIKVYEVTRVFGDQTTEAAIDASADVSGSADASVTASITVSDSLRGTYQVTRVLDIFQLVDLLNDRTNQRIVDTLASYGRSARVVVAVAQVSAQEQRRIIERKVGASTPDTTNAPRAEIGASRTTTADASMSDGTVFAFEYARFCWANGKKAKTGDESAGKPVVISVELDRPGADSDCPEGSSDDARHLRSPQ